MTTNINNSPEYACRTCAKQECGCKDTECQLPCHFYTEQAEQEPVAKLIEMSKANFERHWGKNEFADWIYSDIADLFSDYAAPVQQAEQEQQSCYPSQPHRYAGSFGD